MSPDAIFSYLEGKLVDTIPMGCYTNDGDRAIGVAISNDTA
jgi:hypothetical protein